MEVYLCREINEDEFNEEYFGDVKSVYLYKNNEKLNVHIIDIADEGSFLFDVIKIEVY